MSYHTLKFLNTQINKMSKTHRDISEHDFGGGLQNAQPAVQHFRGS
jgi:hypothetical protein